MKGTTTWIVVWLAAALAACGQDSVDMVTGVGKAGARRLSRVEYDQTLRDLLLDESRSGFAKLPEDVADPFDNDYTTQEASGVLVEVTETLAIEAADRLLADAAKRDQVIGCMPVGVADTACLRSFVTHFGRLALRRPLSKDEIDRYLAFEAYAVEGNDFYIAPAMVISALLQDPEFLYRVEVGAKVPARQGLFRLNDFEVGTRLAYFLWGSTPDDALLDLAEAGKLSSADEVRSAAMRLLTDPRTRARVDRFHAMWLGFQQLPHPPDLTLAMRTETSKLIERVVFEEGRPWSDIFTSTESYIDARLAGIYGMAAPANGFAWMPYDGTASARRGILSHGSFLSVVGKFGDTSPTLRGKLIRERLLCEVVPPPPPNVNVDEPPASTSSPCKWDRYEAHRSVGSCAGCHNQMDPVGFGLENYDQTGRFRAFDNGLPACTIAGEGLLFGLTGDAEPTRFRGPAELGQALVDSGRVEACLVTQVYRLAMGHREGALDAPFLDQLGQSFAVSGRFDELILDLVSTDAFGYRQEEN